MATDGSNGGLTDLDFDLVLCLALNLLTFLNVFVLAVLRDLEACVECAFLLIGGELSDGANEELSDGFS